MNAKGWQRKLSSTDQQTQKKTIGNILHDYTWWAVASYKVTTGDAVLYTASLQAFEGIVEHTPPQKIAFVMDNDQRLCSADYIILIKGLIAEINQSIDYMQLMKLRREITS